MTWLSRLCEIKPEKLDYARQLFGQLTVPLACCPARIRWLVGFLPCRLASLSASMLTAWLTGEPFLRCQGLHDRPSVGIRIRRETPREALRPGLRGDVRRHSEAGARTPIESGCRDVLLSDG